MEDKGPTTTKGWQSLDYRIT